MFAALLSSVLLAGPALEVPWQCGVTKPCTQGHGGFSHTGNSHWAWDFDVNEGEEVWSSSAGVVSFLRMDSDVGGCDQSFGGDANYVVVDHDDGTAIVYMHLLANSSPLAIGDVVRPGTLVGRVGLTGWVCGDHLHHMVMEQCGSPYCQSLPATFADYGDPAQGDSILSTNCPACELVLGGGQTVVSELEPGCFVRETTAWWSTMSGEDDHHFYTLATDDGDPASTGTWRFVVEVPGEYRVEVYVPEDADSQGAVYQVHHDDVVESFPIDQSATSGWQDLGVFTFSGADGERIQLDDNTGEAVDLGRRLGYDAVRLSFVPGGDDTGGGSTGVATDPSGAGGSGADGSTAGEVGTDGAAGSVSAATGGPSGATDADGDALPATFGEQEGDGGCGCRSAGGGGGAWVLVGLVAGWRRRRRTHAPRAMDATW